MNSAGKDYDAEWNSGTSRQIVKALTISEHCMAFGIWLCHVMDIWRAFAGERHDSKNCN